MKLKGGDCVKGGFTFCGIDIADIGLEYAPDNDKAYVWGPTDSNPSEEIFDNHTGGYYFGNPKQPKEFSLRCFYQDADIAKGLMAKVHNLFRTGRSGLLVFKRRPWCYYYATVTKNPDASAMYNFMNGLLVITMKAYYPFARGLSLSKDEDRYFYSVRTDPNHNEIMQNTAILDEDIAPPTQFYNDGQALTFTNPILLYNPGTEYADVSILISGTTTNGSGVVIANKTTGQNCRYHGFSTEGNAYVYTDGINGKTVLNQNGTSEIQFLYHDYGFIQLEPAFPILRGIYAKGEGTTVKTTNILYQEEEEKDWYADKYIYLSDQWHKLGSCTGRTSLSLRSGSVSSKVKRTSIVSMNELEILPETGTEITKLSFIYKPTYA